MKGKKNISNDKIRQKSTLLKKLSFQNTVVLFFYIIFDRFLKFGKLYIFSKFKKTFFRINVAMWSFYLTIDFYRRRIVFNDERKLLELSLNRGTDLVFENLT